MASKAKKPVAKPAAKRAPKPTPKAPAPVAPAPVVVVPPTPGPTADLTPEPVVRVEPTPPAEPKKGLTPAEELIEVEKEIAALQARLWELHHPIVEFPKMVKGRTFNTREEQDAAGPEFKD